MKIFKKNVEFLPRNNKAYSMYFEERSFAVFDIETTGLSPKNSALILSGIILVKDSKATAYEILAETIDDEKEIIEKTISLLSMADYIVTFNGRHFDVPFLQKRAEKYGITFDVKYNLDIYLLLSTSVDFRSQLPDMKQKSVEKRMGIENLRSDTISGKESAMLFTNYMATHDKDTENKILLHNSDDICQLYRLIDSLKLIDIHTALFKRGFPVGDANIEKITFKGHDLAIEGCANLPYDYISFPTEECPCQLSYSKSSSKFELTILCEVANCAFFFDASKLLGVDLAKIEKYPWISSGYLIASDNGNINTLEINAFLLEFLPKLFSNIWVKSYFFR